MKELKKVNKWYLQLVQLRDFWHSYRPEEFLNESERKHVDEEVVDRDSEDSDNDDDLFVNPNHAYVDSDEEDYDNDDEDDWRSYLFVVSEKI